GSLVGWMIGVRGGRPLLEHHGARLHLDAANLERAERWFERFGLWAVFVGRLTPLVRSFISLPAGALGSPLTPYTVLTLLGSAIWCFGFAAAGWALGNGYERLHHATRFADFVVVLALAGALGAAVVHRFRRRRTAAA
ncbi:MAG: DedA family protein, partial [Longimicrobiaceae bacterium]